MKRSFQVIALVLALGWSVPGLANALPTEFSPTNKSMAEHLNTGFSIIGTPTRAGSMFFLLAGPQGNKHILCSLNAKGPGSATSECFSLN